MSDDPKRRAIDGEVIHDPPHEVKRANEPPVVARLVVEIRSDGTRTIARGAMEDHESGEAVAIEATGTTPMALAVSLAKSLFTVPSVARTMARGLLRGSRTKPK